MSKRAILSVIALLVAASVGLGVYQTKMSPSAKAREAAHRFWVAAVAGDLATLDAMRAAEADFTASQVIDSNRGLCYGGPCGGDNPSGNVQWVKGPSLTDAEVLVNSAVWTQDGAPSGRSLAMKRVNGEWKVTRQGAAFSY